MLSSLDRVHRVKAVIRVGPAGWSYDDWKGIVYPENAGSSEIKSNLEDQKVSGPASLLVEYPHAKESIEPKWFFSQTPLLFLLYLRRGEIHIIDFIRSIAVRAEDDFGVRYESRSECVARLQG